jgi:DNA-binding response OmpR family regulator
MSKDKVKIIVVDDDYSFRTAVARILVANKYRVVELSNSLRVISSIIKEKPDLILLDLYMPEADGMEIIQTMKRLKIEIPVLIVSGNLQRLDVRLLKDRGAIDIMVKPIHMKKLLTKVKEILGSGAVKNN